MSVRFRLKFLASAVAVSAAVACNLDPGIDLPASGNEASDDDALAPVIDLPGGGKSGSGGSPSAGGGPSTGGSAAGGGAGAGEAGEGGGPSPK